MKKLVLTLAPVSLLAAAYLFWPMSEVIDTNESRALPAASIETVSELTTLIDQDESLEVYFQREMASDPLKALQAIAAIEHREHRIAAYEAALKAWSDIDPRGLQSWLERLVPSTDIDQALLMLSMNTALPVRLRLAAAYVITADSPRGQALATVISDALVLNAHESILTWLIEHDKAAVGIKRVFSALMTSALDDAIYGLSFMDGADPVQIRAAIQTMINNYRMGEVNGDTLMALESLTPYEIREELLGALLPLLVAEKHLSLVDIDNLLNSLLEGEVKNRYLALVALNWAVKDPHAAASYAEQQSGETREKAVNAVVTTWIEQDLEEADQWLKTVDGNLDLAAGTISRGSARLGNVSIADHWVNRIGDDELRNGTIDHVLNDWYEQSPALGIYQLVYQKSLSTQEKLDMLHQLYPNEVFVAPNEALQQLGRLENIESPY